MSFLFPPDHFPVFNTVAQPGVPPEEYGPPLSFNPYSTLYDEQVSGIDRESFQFVPDGEEISQKRMELLYNVVDDKYRRKLSKMKRREIPGWKSCVWRCCNVDRKIENDWKMGYLARKDISVGPVEIDRENVSESNPLKALVEWRFNLRGAGLKVKNLELRIPHKLYRDGNVVITVCSRDDYTVLLESQVLKPVPRAFGWDDFVIRAELSGTKGIAYQNVQLFRQPLATDIMGDEWKNPFKVVIDMEEA